jgi:aromatic ring-opening dioxygenase catalytic subunit (LigB family)
MPLLPSPNNQENLIALWQKHRQDLFPTAESLPKAIVVVSAHYEEATMKVGGAANPTMLYDYGGFPPETYKVQYPAPGDTLLAKSIVERLNAAAEAAGGVSTTAATLDANRRFDHGVFIPLLFMFPEATIPVIPISVLTNQDAAAHLAVGKALSGLRDEGVFILGSGSSSHNMRLRGGSNMGKTFNERLASVITSGASEAEVTQALASYLKWPGAQEAQLPGLAEHLMPLFTVLGTSHSFHKPADGEVDHQGGEVVAPPAVDFVNMMSWAVTHFTFPN